MSNNNDPTTVTVTTPQDPEAWPTPAPKTHLSVFDWIMFIAAMAALAIIGGLAFFGWRK